MDVSNDVSDGSCVMMILMVVVMGDSNDGDGSCVMMMVLVVMMGVSNVLVMVVV